VLVARSSRVRLLGVLGALGTAVSIAPATAAAAQRYAGPNGIGTIDIGADEFVFAPVATTGAAGTVTDHSAMLSGSVNAKEAPTTYHFEYGPTTAYGSSTATVDADSGVGVAAAASLDGLSPSTTYHYRLVATNAGGVAKGADQSFTTAALPSGPSAPATSTSTASTPVTPAALFGGVRLASSRLTISRGFITVTLRCPSGTVGRCSGQTKLTARRAHSLMALGRATLAIASGKRGKLRVRVSRTGRRLLSRVRRVAGRDTNAARNDAGQPKTTVAAVTISRHRR
jgi:hypothetical protein